MRKLFTFLLALAASVGASWAVPAVAVDGKLPGAFSVSATKKVYFSQGNLRFTRTSTSDAWSTGKFSFMDNQYDYIETSNVSNDYANETAIGFFGWATSNINTPVANTKYLPTNTDKTTSVPYGSGITTGNVNWSDNNNAFANYDWGANTGDLGTGWRTLTRDEWAYLFNARTVNGGTGNGKSYTLGQSVNGTLGVVLYPDDYTGATYTGSDWSTFEDAGCVFLPAAGSRNGTSVNNVGSNGTYWSSTSYSNKSAHYVLITGSYVQPANLNSQYRGYSVRLVSDIAPPVVKYTITFKNYEGTTLQSGEVVKGATPSYTGTTPVKPSTAAYSYTFSGWSPTIAKATANATYTAQFSQAPNQATVDDVIAKINAIGEVAYTPECKDKIDIARTAYNALTDEQKALVSNYATLEAAEARYAYLTPVVIIPNEDPKNAGTYYSTYYDGNRLLMLPENVEAYVAYVQGDALMMQLIAESGDILPKATPVIFRSEEEHFTLLPQDEGAVDMSEVENALQGSDIIAPAPANTYVLSGTAEYGVGFYRINSENLKAHKAYVVLAGLQNNAPRRLRFVFNEEKVATGVENTDASAKIGGSEKVIENGEFYIIKNGVKYNAQGQIVK